MATVTAFIATLRMRIARVPVAVLTVSATLLTVGASRDAGAQPRSAPTPTDYAARASWLCHPLQAGACATDLSTTVLDANGAVHTERYTPAAQPAIDCFYVYPTVSTDTTDASDLVPDDAERNVIRLQFARFGAQCRLFAPVYRQRTLPSLLRSMSNGTVPDLLGVGYQDVRDAWHYYLAHENRGRGVVLIGHSQGARILSQLIRDEIDGKPVQARLVSAYVIGMAGGVQVPVGKDLGGTFRAVPACRRATQTGCVVAYSTYRSTVPPPDGGLFGRAADSTMSALCTNPASLDGGDVELRGYLDAAGRTVVNLKGSNPWQAGGTPVATPFVRISGLLTGRCVTDGPWSYLRVTVHRDANSAASRDIQGNASSAIWGLHLVDLEVAMGDLIDLVGTQATSYLTKTRR